MVDFVSDLFVSDCYGWDFISEENYYSLRLLVWMELKALWYNLQMTNYWSFKLLIVHSFYWTDFFLPPSPPCPPKVNILSYVHSTDILPWQISLYGQRSGNGYTFSPEEDLCWIIPQVPQMTPLVKGLHWAFTWCIWFSKRTKSFKKTCTSVVMVILPEVSMQKITMDSSRPEVPQAEVERAGSTR